MARAPRPGPVLAAALAVAALVGAALPGAAGAFPLIAAAGDIACPPGATVDATHCQQAATAQLIRSRSPVRVLALGDVQYRSATTAEFASFNASWGAFKPLVSPAPGNHEYLTAGASGYYGYFGAAAGDPRSGYYSFDVGSWHVVSLNSNCATDGSCPGAGHVGVSDAEVRWLQADLAAHPGACTLAYWHHPLVGDGNGGDNPAVQPLWTALYQHGADLVLNGHDHAYERFVALSPSGAPDATRGLTEIVVGTGGEDHAPLASGDTRRVSGQATAFGAIFITLATDRFTWDYRLLNGTQFDHGTTLCHRPTAAFTVTAAPARKATTFDASAATDPYRSALVRFAWSFGDGTTGLGVRVSHVYATAGTRTARLTVTNAGGATGVVQRTVAVPSAAALLSGGPIAVLGALAG